jgi:hypothetical protein
MTNIPQLSEQEIQVNRAKYQAMVGKAVTIITTGLKVKGTVLAFKEDKHGFNLVIEHEAVNWGGDYYTRSEPFARKCDDWGSLKNVEILTK